MIHVYTGNGKGKTTAALGLCLRAAGAGMRIYFCQFIKGRPYSELKALKKFRNIKVEQFGRGCFIKKSPKAEDIALAKKGMEKVKRIISGKKFNLIVLDEVNVALGLKLLDKNEVLKVLKAAPKNVELVLTGRNAPAQIVKIADLVSSIEEKKHYYRKGVKARKGIEF